MLKALMSLFRTGRSRSGPQISRLTYSIGDIHGRFDLLERMLQKLKQDSDWSNEKPLIVFLGDYVDRGPQSCEVLERLLALRREAWCDVEYLMGNHEEALLNFLMDSTTGLSWVDFGGAATLASYQVTPPHLRFDPAGWKETSRALGAAMPEAQIQLIRHMKLYLIINDYLFVHAGVRPDLPLSEQGAETFLWIRGPFLTAAKACNFVVVHGHTPEDRPTNSPWRIGLDTGAYATGILTAVRLKDDTREIIQVR